MRLFFRQWLWMLPLLILPISAFFFSSGLEIEADNLKYMGIAWSMQETGNYLVPFANGSLYTDKPPLLFWSILACWHLFGINALGLQVLICLILGAWVLITRATYHALFPEDKLGKSLIPYLMIGSFALLDYAHFFHVDLFLVTGVLLTNLGIIKRLTQAFKHANLCIILGIFIGLFAKGPVIFVFTLLPFLVSLFFNYQRYRPHLFKIIGWMIVGTLLCLVAWVLPAVLTAGQEFFQQIAYKQIANRAGFVDDKSYFFYLLKLPYLLLPWSLGILFFRKFFITLRDVWKRNSFILMIVIVGVIVLSCFGQKRFWYLLPCVPYCMIVLTRSFVFQKERWVRWLKVIGLSIGLLFTAISPYYFLQTENALQLNLFKQVFLEQKKRGDSIAMLFEGGPVYRFNYLAKMSVIPVLNDIVEMQAWLNVHPKGIVIVHGRQCPESLQAVFPPQAMEYVLCHVP